MSICEGNSMIITLEQLINFRRSMGWCNAWRDIEEWEYMKQRMQIDLGLECGR